MSGERNSHRVPPLDVGVEHPCEDRLLLGGAGNAEIAV